MLSLATCCWKNGGAFSHTLNSIGREMCGHANLVTSLTWEKLRHNQSQDKYDNCLQYVCVQEVCVHDVVYAQAYVPKNRTPLGVKVPKI